MKMAKEPEQPITREELDAIIARGTGGKGLWDVQQERRQSGQQPLTDQQMDDLEQMVSLAREQRLKGR